MVTTNFTISGDKLECVGKLKEGKPVFDLYLKEDGSELFADLSYAEFVAACKSTARELEHLAASYGDGGDKVWEFYCDHKPEEDIDD